MCHASVLSTVCIIAAIAGVISTAPSTSAAPPVQNMNGLYTIANQNSAAGVQFSTDYATKDAEYFDVYSPPIRTRYGEVFWTMMNPVTIPEAIRERFAGKSMAVIGYESNQVRKTPDGELPVPITWAYNHHYVAYLLSSNSKLIKADTTKFLGGEFRNMYDPRDFWVPQSFDAGASAPPGVQNAHLFSEGNGGEFRKTFHGYPNGYASLIFSPSTFHISVMQIDTHNRDHPGYDYVAGPLPKASQAPPNASYSGLLECPCTDRITKEIHIVYSALTKDVCKTTLTNDTECFAAAVSMGASDKSPQQTVSDEKLPTGCSIVRSKDGSEQVIFNTAKGGTSCGGGQEYAGKSMALNNSVSLSVNLDGSSEDGEAIITLTGPSDVWFGVGLNAQAMADLPYAIIINGSGDVQERKLADHDRGTQLASSVHVTSNTVNNGVRTVVLTRSMKGLTSDHFTFSPVDQSSLPFISAIGNGPTFAEHKFKGASVLALTVLDGATCVCHNNSQGSINKLPFKKDCWDEPRGDLIQQKNPTCWVDTYVGGLRCCHHEWILLDKDQNPWPDQIDEYYMKFRFWFQEYNEAAPSHLNLVRIHWQTEVMSTEYDVPRKSPEIPPENAVHQITSRWKVGDMMHDCDVRTAPDCTGLRQNKTGIKLIYAGAHCHAPSCISQELYNADTGELLCRHEAAYGEGTEVFDEKGYLWIPPCLWGSPDEGLLEPIFLSFETNLLSVKRNNNTYGHYGEMALLQMKGILV